MSDPVGIRLLITIWLGQLVSTVGSALTGFVLGVWVYQETGSVTQFSVIFVANILPGVLVAPIAGMLADRFDRRWLMLLSDLVAALSTATLALLVTTDNLQVWHIWAATAVNSAFNSVHQVSYQSMTPALVGKRHLARFNGLSQVSRAAQTAAPLVAGALVVTIGVDGVMLLDLATFAIAAATLLLVRLPKSVTQPVGGHDRDEPKLHQAAAGWRYLRERSALLSLVVLFGAFNFLYGIAGVLVQPLILSFTTPDALGVLMFAGGAGVFAGSVVVGTWGGPKRRINSVLGGLLLGGVALIGHSLAPSFWLIAVVAPLFLFVLPFLHAATITLVQLKTDPAVLGRVMAAVSVIAGISVPVAYVLAGPLSDQVFEPLMQPDGALAGTVGSVIGTGTGRGTALVFAVTGLLMLLVTAGAWAYRPLRRVDDLPDGLPDTAADEPVAPAAEQPATPAPESPAEPVTEPAGH